MNPEANGQYCADDHVRLHFADVVAPLGDPCGCSSDGRGAGVGVCFLFWLQQDLCNGFGYLLRGRPWVEWPDGGKQGGCGGRHSLSDVANSSFRTVGGDSSDVVEDIGERRRACAGKVTHRCAFSGGTECGGELWNDRDEFLQHLDHHVGGFFVGFFVPNGSGGFVCLWGDA